MPDTDIKSAYEFADSVRVTIMESVCHFEELDLKVTMSFGIGKLDPAISAEENIKIADENLYKAKESGRNRVVAPSVE